MSGVRASPGANILAAMFALLDICVFRLILIQWHIRLARRTYKSVQTEKCEWSGVRASPGANILAAMSPC